MKTCQCWLGVQWSVPLQPVRPRCNNYVARLLRAFLHQPLPPVTAEFDVALEAVVPAQNVTVLRCSTMRRRAHGVVIARSVDGKGAPTIVESCERPRLSACACELPPDPRRSSPAPAIPAPAAIDVLSWPCSITRSVTHTSFAQAARDVLVVTSITLMVQRDCEQNAACDVISSCAHTDLHCPCRAAAAAAILRCSSLSSILPKIALACRALTQHHNTARTCAHTIPITTKADVQYSG